MKFLHGLGDILPTWMSKKSTFRSSKFPGWKLSKRIGRGGFSTVHLLKNRDRKICVKLINTDENAEMTEFFLMEICIHKKLKHPNIIELLDAEVKCNMLHLFIEYAAKGTVLSRLNSKKMTLADAHRFFQQLIEGVEYLHQRGIAHRDLKPENLLIDKRGTLKIGDFGLAVKYRQGGKRVPMSDLCGTKTYMAPEIFRRQYDGEPVDVWACGIILVNLLTGLPPWSSATMKCSFYTSWATNRNTNCQPWIQMDVEAVRLAKRMLHPDPRQRATIAEIKSSYYFKSITGRL